MKVGWAPDSLQSIGEKFVNTISAALWYLDSHHQRLASRGIHLPKEVGALQGYDWRKKKMKEPRISSSGLDGHIQSLSRTLSQPWLAKREYTELRSLTEGITDAMHNYKKYLDQKCESMKEAHKQTAPRRLVSDVLEVRTLEAADSPVKECYAAVNEELAEKMEYEPVCLNEFAPVDRYQRRHWMEKLELPVRSMLYRFPYGNHLGVVSFIWKIPEMGAVNESKVSVTANHEA